MTLAWSSGPTWWEKIENTYYSKLPLSQWNNRPDKGLGWGWSAGVAVQKWWSLECVCSSSSVWRTCTNEIEPRERERGVAKRNSSLKMSSGFHLNSDGSNTAFKKYINCGILKFLVYEEAKVWKVKDHLSCGASITACGENKTRMFLFYEVVLQWVSRTSPVWSGFTSNLDVGCVRENVNSITRHWKRKLETWFLIQVDFQQHEDPCFEALMDRWTYWLENGKEVSIVK